MIMVTEGEVAPDFSLEADDGKTVKLSALKGKKVVLFFYPKDDTPGCTTEACSFRDNLSMLQSKGAEVLGISILDVKSKVRFKEKYNLTYPLLADPEHEVSAKYGVWQLKHGPSGNYMGIVRTTFVVDEKGVVKKVFEHVKPEGHAIQVLEAL
jgi:peroxiredoxin Q/BCP